MKKLILAAVAVAFAAVAQAASVTWSASGFLYDGADTPAKVTSKPTAYLMMVTAGFGQAELVSAFAAANGDAAATLAAMTGSGALASGAGNVASTAKLSTTTSTLAITGDTDVYAVIFSNGKMFISNTATATYDSVTSEASASLGSLSTISKNSFDAASGAQGAGWYGVAAVPEPTSGLLLLLGMAGLALKRKQA